jgi:hypothetical protein
VLYRVVVGLILTISACTDFKKDFLCGPDGYCGVEIAVPVDYQGRQIQLTGWFEKPIGAGPFPVVIALHSCAGYTYGVGALRLWVDLLPGRLPLDDLAGPPGGCSRAVAFAVRKTQNGALIGDYRRLAA